MNNPVVLFVDDELSRRDQFLNTFGDSAIITFADNPKDAIELIRKTKFDKIFLDHDLGFHSMDGNDIAACLFQSVNSRIKIFVHSANPSGVDRIRHTLQDLNMECETCCFFDSDFLRKARDYIEDD